MPDRFKQVIERVSPDDWSRITEYCIANRAVVAFGGESLYAFLERHEEDLRRLEISKGFLLGFYETPQSLEHKGKEHPSVSAAKTLIERAPEPPEIVMVQDMRIVGEFRFDKNSRFADLEEAINKAYILK